MNTINRLFESAARLDRAGIVVTRVGLVVVLVWIGGLKVFRYEDEGIVPFVANSPLMNFFYRQPAGEYRQHMNREGELVPANREWHERNGTYRFAYGLGLGDRRLRRDDRAAPLAAAGRGRRQLPGLRDVARDPVVPGHDARVLGAAAGQPGARLPAAVRRRPAGRSRTPS